MALCWYAGRANSHLKTVVVVGLCSFARVRIKATLEDAIGLDLSWTLCIYNVVYVHYKKSRPTYKLSQPLVMAAELLLL